jgi:hypothetical protein
MPHRSTYPSSIPFLHAWSPCRRAIAPKEFLKKSHSFLRAITASKGISVAIVSYPNMRLPMGVLFSSIGAVDHGYTAIFSALE